jgi:hypothetical protein
MRFAVLPVCFFMIAFSAMPAYAQKNLPVTFVHNTAGSKIDVLVNGKPFTSFFYPDTLAKPVLWPIYTAGGTAVTRGYPLEQKAGEPTDHPHHTGLWLNFENVNGLDFWNNSFAIPADKKYLYGHIKTLPDVQTNNGKTGTLVYNGNWLDAAGNVLLEEVTQYNFSGTENIRIIDRITTLIADTLVLFKDAKDGLLGLRVAHELQIPAKETKKYTDDKGNVTTVSAVTDSIANGNYVTSEGKQGDSAWSTRARWCSMFAKVQNDSVSVVIIDHPGNPNYPTFWHARGYGLFAANPLGEAIFTNGKSRKDLSLNKGDYVTFRFRIVIANDSRTLPADAINKLADEFGRQ